LLEIFDPTEEEELKLPFVELFDLHRKHKDLERVLLFLFD
jgi:hypothetical protein